MGNTVVVKPAPQDPLAVTVFGEILHEAGFPAGVVNVVTGSSPDAGQALVASPHVDMIQKMEHLGASKSVVGLVIPTGYSFNLDGTNI